VINAFEPKGRKIEIGFHRQPRHGDLLEVCKQAGWSIQAIRICFYRIKPRGGGNLPAVPPGVLMPIDGATAIAYTGACVGLVGGGVALFNARKAVCWKRAELANTYMMDFNNNPELVFAGRCLDWQRGKLIVPESLQPYLPEGEKLIDHDRRVYAIAVSPFLQVGEMDNDPRVQIYRTSPDMFLS